MISTEMHVLLELLDKKIEKAVSVSHIFEQVIKPKKTLLFKIKAREAVNECDDDPELKITIQHIINNVEFSAFTLILDENDKDELKNQLLSIKSEIMNNTLYQ